MSKIVVDTCGWVEWLQESILASMFELPLRDVSQLIVPTAIQTELYKWTLLNFDADRAREILHYTTQAQVVTLTQAIALHAATLAIAHHLSFADSVIYATALHHDATLLTSDAHFKDLPNVTYIKKTKP